MRRRLIASVLALAALSCTALSCTAERRAQVLVTIDAQLGVDRLSDTVHVRIWGRDPNGPFDDELLLTETGTRYPWTVALRPRDDDPRRVFRFEATAVNPAGDSVATVRVISGYEERQVLHVYLLLQDSCIGVPCTDLSSTCRDGRCVPTPEPTFFDPDAGFPDAGAPECTSPSVETCDHMDNDCDRSVDEGFDLLEDEAHCGGCGRACDPPHATGVCEGGSCAIALCDEGWADCDTLAVTGCEASLLDAATCGDCATGCRGATPYCEPGPSGPTCVATCTVGVLCGGSCVDVQTSTEHCGRCGNACLDRSFATAICELGTCVYGCVAGHDSCNGPPEGPDGCEQDVSGDPSHCGGCGRACTPASQCQEPTCTMGSCGQRSVPNGRSCEADGVSCTVDQCVDGACTAGVCMDAGRDAGREAGPGDAGREAGPGDAGGTCGGDICFGWETCCGTACCNVGSGDTCCGGSCCTMGLEACIGGVCVPVDPDGGSVDMCGGCPMGPCCWDGVDFAWECCDTTFGEMCTSWGCVYPPDAGGP